MRALAASMPSLAQKRSAALAQQLSQLQAQLAHTHSALDQQRQEAVSMKLALEEKVSAANDETAALRAQLEEMQATSPLKRSPLRQLQADMLTPKLLHPVSSLKLQSVVLCSCLFYASLIKDVCVCACSRVCRCSCASAYLCLHQK